MARCSSGLRLDRREVWNANETLRQKTFLIFLYTVQPDEDGPRAAGPATLAVPWLGRTVSTDHVLRWTALALVLAGPVIGFSHPVAIALSALGLLLLALGRSGRGGPRAASR